MNRSLLAITSLALAHALLLAERSSAEEFQTIEEIVVTAQKRQESLQEVPVAVSALSAEGMERANIRSILDLSNAVSGVTINTIGTYMTPVVRGAGTVVPGSAVYQAVATYVDDAYMPRSYTMWSGIDFAESVQILKGPQGALYGRNATAGAIIVTTKKPEIGTEPEADISLSYAEYGEGRVTGRIASGIGENLAVSLQAHFRQNDGYFDTTPASQNPNNGEHKDSEENVVVAQLVFEPADNVRLSAKLARSEYNSNLMVFDNVGEFEIPSVAQIIQLNPLLAPGVLENIIGNPGLNASAFHAAGLSSPQVLLATILGSNLGAPAPNAIGIASLVGFSPEFGVNNDNLINSCEIGTIEVPAAGCETSSFANLEDTTASFRIEVDFDRFDFMSTFAFRDGSQGSGAGVADIDANSPGAQILSALGLPNFGLGFTGTFVTEDFQLESRISSNDTWDWQWIAGINYFEESSDRHLVQGNSFGGAVEAARNSWENTSLSVYAQFTYPLTEQLSFSLGGRFTEDEIELTDEVDFTLPPERINPPVFAVGPLGTLEDSESVFTYLARLEYQAQNWLAYGGVATGYKSASFNNDGPAFGGADSEEITSIEFGFKSEWAEGRLQVNGSVFLYDYDRPHISFIDNATGGQILLSIDQGEVYGFDLDLVGIAGQRTNWFLNLTALESEYEDDTAFFNADLGLTSILATGGKQMAGASPLQVAAGLDYSFPFPASGELIISPSVNYNSGAWYDAENRVGTGGADDDAYTFVNLSLRYVPHDSNWKASLWAKNLTDEEYYEGGFVANGFFLLGIPANPRQVGATITFSL